jgi:hypothetical protein
MKIKINKSYLSTVLNRVLPNVHYDINSLKHLYEDKNIKAYFKGFRSHQEYPGLYNFFASRGFDMSLADKVRKEIKHGKERFLNNILKINSLTFNKRYNRGLCGISQESLSFLCQKATEMVFVNDFSKFLSSSRPTSDEILFQINKTASQGLPNPFIKKRDILDNLSQILDDFLSRKLKPSDVFYYPSATFSRTQIRASGLKERVVHAVQANMNIIESNFYLDFMNKLNRNTCIDIGRTQLEISKVTSSYKDYYAITIDYSGWDITRQQVLGVISFEFIIQSLCLNKYFSKFLLLCRNYYLTLPMFHPTVKMTRREVGTVSGSGFTSLENSLSNFSILTIVIFEYCKRHGIDPYKFDFKINVLGDDSIIGFKEKVDYKEIFSIANNMFGVNMRLEGISEIGDDNIFYLGSEWRSGAPFRQEKLLVASVIFGSGNFPKMSTRELLQSRFLEVFGNTASCEYYFKRLRIRLKNRTFFFRELASPFKTGARLQDRPEFLNIAVPNRNDILTKDSRGFWYDFSYDTSKLNDLWKSR